MKWWKIKIRYDGIVNKDENTKILVMILIFVIVVRIRVKLI